MIRGLLKYIAETTEHPFDHPKQPNMEHQDNHFHSNIYLNLNDFKFVLL